MDEEPLAAAKKPKNPVDPSQPKKVGPFLVQPLSRLPQNKASGAAAACLFFLESIHFCTTMLCVICPLVQHSPQHDVHHLCCELLTFEPVAALLTPE